MADSKELTCKLCHSEVMPGTVHCFRHKKDPPYVGGFTAVEGQLAWQSSTLGCEGKAQERLLAVTLNKTTQMIVVSVAGLSRSSPRLEVKVADSNDPDRTTHVTIPLVALLNAIQESIESVDATRELA